MRRKSKNVCFLASFKWNNFAEDEFSPSIAKIKYAHFFFFAKDAEEIYILIRLTDEHVHDLTVDLASKSYIGGGAVLWDVSMGSFFLHGACLSGPTNVGNFMVSLFTLWVLLELISINVRN